MPKHDTPGIKQGPVPRAVPLIADIKHHDKFGHQRTNQSSQDTDNVTTSSSNDNSKAPPPPTSPTGASNSSSTQAHPLPPAGATSSSEADSSLPSDSNCDSEADADNTPRNGNGTPDRVHSILQQMLSPPDSDIAPCTGDQNIHCRFHFHRPPPTIKLGPFLPQPGDPSKQRVKPFNDRRNVINRRNNFRGNNYNTGSGGNGSGGSGDGDGDDNSNDGDDEEEDNSSSSSSDTEPPSTPSPTDPAVSTSTAHQRPPTPSRPITRSQTKPSTTSPPSPTTPLKAIPSSKRKRATSLSAPPSPTINSTLITQGDSVSKRLRNSLSGSSPLPDPLELKHTRGEQKKSEAKLGKDHVFDPHHPGSMRREVVDAKSGAKEWRRESLHQEPWDGSKSKE